MDVGVGGVHGHEDGVEVVAIDGVDEGFRAVVAGDAEVTDDLLVVHLDESFHGSALGEDRVDVFGQADVVELPEIDVVGVEELERLLDHAEGAVAGALLGLGGEEGRRCGGSS